MLLLLQRMQLILMISLFLVQSNSNMLLKRRNLEKHSKSVSQLVISSPLLLIFKKILLVLILLKLLKPWIAPQIPLLQPTKPPILTVKIRLSVDKQVSSQSKPVKVVLEEFLLLMALKVLIQLPIMWKLQRSTRQFVFHMMKPQMQCHHL